VRKVPSTDKSKPQKKYPFGWRALPLADIVRTHASSGTTGKDTVVCYTQKDIDDWADVFARCYEMAGVTREDRVQITPDSSDIAATCPWHQRREATRKHAWIVL
jgi:phenylacetate-CoA ligase